ncbi:MAG: hypothetical protein OXC62_03510 [Aestuariivita sp.]|nr:hypothetical protein [Aestuariivita sp.]
MPAQQGGNVGNHPAAQARRHALDTGRGCRGTASPRQRREGPGSLGRPESRPYVSAWETDALLGVNAGVFLLLLDLIFFRLAVTTSILKRRPVDATISLVCCTLQSLPLLAFCTSRGD